MALDPGGGGGRQPGRGEIVDFGRRARHRSRRLGTLLLICLIVSTVVLVVVRSGSHRGPASPPPMAVTDIGHPILGVHASWQLFGFDGRAVVAVQFARGRIVRTTIPGLEGDGIVSLVAGRGEALVRPLDNVPGYVVPDGGPARPLTGVLANGGTLLPGPTPAEQWLDENSGSIVLVGRGKAERARLAERALLSPHSQTITSDGDGGLLLVDASGIVYDVSSGLLRSVGPDLMLAVGPRNWLGLNCGVDSGPCREVVISAATRAERVLSGPAVSANPWPWQALPGSVSPDGTTAAVVVPGSSQNQARLELVSMRSGAAVRVAVPVPPSSTSQSLAWSPDSRWLFVVAARGTLAVVDGRTGRQQRINLGVSGLRQIVIRPAAG
jgi:hypothetical protein